LVEPRTLFEIGSISVSSGSPSFMSWSALILGPLTIMGTSPSLPGLSSVTLAGLSGSSLPSSLQGFPWLKASAILPIRMLLNSLISFSSPICTFCPNSSITDYSTALGSVYFLFPIVIKANNLFNSLISWTPDFSFLSFS
jgi:hypothetical protein